MIKIENVSIKYIKDYYSLYNLNLEINGNTILFGDETSGNNFLLRILAKIDKHYEGNIFVDNVNLKQLKDKDLNIAYLPKQNYFFKNKSILKNLTYPLKIRKIDGKKAKNDVILMLKQYNLENFLKNIENSNLIFNNNYNLKKLKIRNFEKDFLNCKMKYLSFSMQKIILLLRAIIWKPNYILLENFFENLDSNYYELANEILLNLTKTIIIATEKQNGNLTSYKNFYEISFNAGSIVTPNN